LFTQTAFGIIFSSCREFGELTTAPVDLGCNSNVSIEWGDVPVALEHPTLRHNWWQIALGEYLLHVPAVARFHVTSRSIMVSPEPGADDAAVRLYLFGSVMGALLHLRGVLPLHGSAVFLPQHAGSAVFTGVSTSGKSTLAAALTRRGYGLMADDISVIGVCADGPMLLPGLARSKLWRKSRDFLGLDPAEGKPVRVDKYAFEVAISRRPAPILHVCELSVRDGCGVTLTKVEGMEKLLLLDRNTFRRNYVSGFRQSGPHMQRIARLAGQVRVSRIVRPPSEVLSVDAVMDLLEQDWASQSARQPALASAQSEGY
jgi:hypothetical protein